MVEVAPEVKFTANEVLMAQLAFMSIALIEVLTAYL